MLLGFFRSPGGVLAAAERSDQHVDGSSPLGRVDQADGSEGLQLHQVGEAVPVQPGSRELAADISALNVLGLERGDIGAGRQARAEKCCQLRRGGVRSRQRTLQGGGLRGELGAAVGEPVPTWAATWPGAPGCRSAVVMMSGSAITV